MSIKDTPFLNQPEASELFRRMAEKTTKQRRKLAARKLSPRELLNLLRNRD